MITIGHVLNVMSGISKFSNLDFHGVESEATELWQIIKEYKGQSVSDEQEIRLMGITLQINKLLAREYGVNIQFINGPIENVPDIGLDTQFSMHLVSIANYIPSEQLKAYIDSGASIVT